MLVTDNNGQKLLVNSFCMYVVHNHIPLLDLLKSLSLFHCFERVVECYKWESFHKLDHLSQIPCSLPRRSSWHLGVGVVTDMASLWATDRVVVIRAEGPIFREFYIGVWVILTGQSHLLTHCKNYIQSC